MDAVSVAVHYDDDSADDPIAEHLEEGWSRVREGDLDGARRAARACLSIAELPEAHNLLGYVYAMEGEMERALEEYRRAIALDEFFTEALLNAAELLLHPLGQLEEALSLIDDAIENGATPDAIADAVLLKAEALLQHGEPAAAAEAMTDLPDGPFENPEIDLLIGRAFFEVGELDRAGVSLEAATQTNPTNPEAFYYYGLWLEAQGDRPGATVALLQSRDLDETLPPPPQSSPRPVFERRVRAALKGLPRDIRDALEGALVVVTELPGREVIAEGIDPRACALAEEISDGQVSRLFVYQLNCERVATSPDEVTKVCAETIEREVRAALSASAAVAEEDD